MPSARYTTAMAIIGDFENLDVPTMLFRHTNDCIHTFLPLSIARPPKDNTAFGEHITRLRGIMPKFPVIAEDVMEDAEKNMTIVHVVSHTHFYDSVIDQAILVKDWEYQCEYIFRPTMTEAGDKIEESS